MYDPEQITYFAETDARNSRVPFGIKAKDRTQHVYVIGKTGVGKSTMLENMVVQDIRNGNGFAFIDPHGKTAELLLEYIPPERIKDVIYFAPQDLEFPISFNVMEDVGFDKRHLVVSGLMSSFKKIWQDAWSARMEYILTNTLLALLEYPGATLLSVNRMLSDKKFRDKVVDNISDTAVRSFWVDEFAKYTERMAAEAVPAIQNKVGQFTANPLIRNIIGQPVSSFDIREVMDNRKILIINLSKGLVGEANANLLGSMIVTKIYLAAMSRADVPLDKLAALPNFYLFVDEFQNFANESFADILSEARKYKLNLTIAHQYIEQMPEEVRNAVFGNVGTMITFRVGAYDAEVLEKEFMPQFTAQDLVNLGKFQAYMRLMIDGMGSHPFSAATLPPLELPEKSVVKEVLESSRKQFARPRKEVEEIIRAATELGRESDEEKNKRQEQTKNNKINSENQKKQNSQSLNNRNNFKIGKETFKEITKTLEVKKDFIKELPKPEVPLEQEIVSLSKLKPFKKDDGKKISPENKNDLKNALSAVLGDAFKKIEDKKDDSQNKSSYKQPSNDSNNKKEIPEKELRDMLDVKNLHNL